MASSQVEFASSSPFGCVLRDRNQHNGCRTRDSNAFQKNFNDLVPNQLSSCRNAGSNENSHPGIDLADLWVHHPQATTNENNHHARETGHTRISEHSNSNENSHQHIDYTDLWVHIPQGNNDENSQKTSNLAGKCDSARDTVLAVERKSEIGVSSRPLAYPPRGRSQDGAQSQPVSRGRSPESSRPVPSSRRKRSLGGASSGPPSTSQKGKSQNGISSSPVLTSQRADNSAEVPNLGAVSSLVQKWRNFEGKKSSLAGCSSKCNSSMVLADNASFVEAPARGSEACDESVDIRPDTPTISEESNGDWESVRTGFSASPGRDSDTTENERIRVADIIKKLSSNGEEQNDRDQAVCHVLLPRVRTSVDQSEQRSFSPVSCSPRIRGQAFYDLQMQMERERHKELESLAGYKAVSKFSHKGRIQAMLRIRFMLRGAEEKDYRRLNCMAPNSKGLKQSAIVHLREKFSLGPKHCASHSRSPQVKVVDYDTGIEKSSVSCQQRKDNLQKKLTEPINPPIVDSVTSADAEGSLKSNSVDQAIDTHESNYTVEKNTVQVQSSDSKENHQSESPDQENTPATVSKGSSDMESSVTLMPVEGDINRLESDSTVQNSEIFYQEAISGLDDIQQCPSSDSCRHRKPEFPVMGTSFQCTEGNVYSEFEEANNQLLAGNGNSLTNEISEAQGDWEEEEDNNHPFDCSWVSDVSHQLSGLEELQSDYYQQEAEINHDWINEVARPRSTWEDLRQERYQEMLDPFMENDEIRSLLQRKSVSSFLSSGMRERIDCLMMSRTQQITRKDQLDGESEQGRTDKEEEHGGGEEEEEYEHDEGGEEEEEDSIVYNDDYEYQDHEIEHNAAKSYINQTTSWVHYQDHEVCDSYSDQAASPYTQQSPLTNVSTLESQWSMNHHSVEMELIYQLKGNMEQLHQEISELRRSIKSCVNMQMELQQSIKQEIAASSCQPGKQKRKERSDSSRGGRCCICHEVPIDSLLYRCGHMCTCFACAHELQWGSGKCPVCQAPILDIVRAYAAHS